MTKSEKLVYCLHCKTKVTRAREIQHRKLANTPYVTTEKRAGPSRAGALGFRLSTDVNVGQHNNDEEGEGYPDDPLVEVPGGHFNDEDVDTGTVIMETDNVGVPMEGDEVDDDIEGAEDVLAAMRKRWRGVVCEEEDEDEEEDGDSDDDETTIPQEDPDEEDTENPAFDWDSLNVEYNGLSAWDQLGEGFECNVAAIGQSITIFPYKGTIGSQNQL